MKHITIKKKTVMKYLRPQQKTRKKRKKKNNRDHFKKIIQKVFIL